MVKVSKAESAANAADVLLAASQVMREQGTANATMANIAAKAGLTHGAIYRHFTNKDDLAASAITADFDRIVELLQDMLLKDEGASSYAASYLTPGHRDRFDWGCPVAPLAAEVHRNARQVQSAFCNGLKRNIEALATVVQKGNAEERRKTAVVMLAALSGAMAMARATRKIDPALSNEILKVTTDVLTTVGR
jgi:TetR/AcrR family transcriptional regulator, transcriptional repressor for nem operon